MQRKQIWSLAAVLFAVIFLILPWQQVETNGTGDGLSRSQFRGYRPLLMAPALDRTLGSAPNVPTWVQPDWSLVSAEALLAASVVGILLLIGRSDHPTQLSAVQKAARGLIVVGVLFFATVVSMAFLSYRLDDIYRWTVHTYEVIAQLSGSLSSLQDVETGERGYLINSRPEFLLPFQNGLPAVDKHIARVQFLTEDNPYQLANVKDLRALAQARMAQAQAIVTERKKNPLSVISVERQNQGRKIMDAYRVQTDKMVQTEEKLLQTRVDALRVVQYVIWVTIAVLTTMAAAVLAWVFRVTRTAIAEEQRRVDELNSEVEQRKKTEKTLKDTTVTLARSNADLQQFAYVASHDLQEPLRAVTGFLTLLTTKLGDDLDADSQKYIKHAVEGSMRMRSLINDLLTYARVESRAKEFEPVPLMSVLDRVKTDLSVQIAEADAQILSDDLPTISGDPTQLGQLFQNLIGNAIKFRSSAAPIIKIGCSPEDGEWRFSVQDNGRGFDMEHAERIFVIFQRLQGREQASGTGIGLALCKKIVERHQGRIWVESKPDHGSTFFFVLPRQ